MTVHRLQHWPVRKERLAAYQLVVCVGSGNRLVRDTVIMQIPPFSSPTILRSGLAHCPIAA